MSKKKNNQAAPIEPAEEQSAVVEMTDDEGNIYLYTEELIIPLGEDRFAILVEATDEDDKSDDEPEVIIAKIVVDENGEDLYIEPTDEEFEKVQAAYDSLFDEDEVGNEK